MSCELLSGAICTVITKHSSHFRRDIFGARIYECFMGENVSKMHILENFMIAHSKNRTDRHTASLFSLGVSIFVVILFWENRWRCSVRLWKRGSPSYKSSSLKHGPQSRPLAFTVTHIDKHVIYHKIVLLLFLNLVSEFSAVFLSFVASMCQYEFVYELWIIA